MLQHTRASLEEFASVGSFLDAEELASARSAVLAR